MSPPALETNKNKHRTLPFGELETISFGKTGSAWHAGSQERLGSQLLDAPPPLRLSPHHAPAASDAPSSPSTEDEDNSAVFHSSQLSSPRSGPCSNLFKPTALKTDLPILDLPNSQATFPHP